MLVDAHAHIDRYGERIAQAIQQINEHRIITIGVSMDIESYQSTMMISELSAYIDQHSGSIHGKLLKKRYPKSGKPDICQLATIDQGNRSDACTSGIGWADNKPLIFIPSGLHSPRMTPMLSNGGQDEQIGG